MPYQNRHTINQEQNNILINFNYILSWRINIQLLRIPEWKINVDLMTPTSAAYSSIWMHSMSTSIHKPFRTQSKIVAPQDCALQGLHSNCLRCYDRYDILIGTRCLNKYITVISVLWSKLSIHSRHPVTWQAR